MYSGAPLPTEAPPEWVTTLIVAEKSFVAPWIYEPETPRIVWYYRILALNNARAVADDYHRRKQEQQSRNKPRIR